MFTDYKKKYLELLDILECHDKLMDSLQWVATQDLSYKERDSVADIRAVSYGRQRTICNELIDLNSQVSRYLFRMTNIKK